MIKTITVWQGKKRVPIAFGMTNRGADFLILADMRELIAYKTSSVHKGSICYQNTADISGYLTNNEDTFLSPFGKADGELRDGVGVTIKSGKSQKNYRMEQGMWQSIYL